VDQHHRPHPRRLCLGDGIETFIDQGRYRKGSDASPDLAALAGRRMVYANEPRKNSKFSDGLIKELTSDEPKGGVRELMKPPFELQITFTNTVSANTCRDRHRPRHPAPRPGRAVDDVISRRRAGSAAQGQAQGRSAAASSTG
jgi:hypothetical protein